MFVTPAFAQASKKTGRVALLSGAAVTSQALAPAFRAFMEQMRLIDALIGLANRLPAGAQRAREVIPSVLRERQADLYAAMRHSMAMSSRGTSWCAPARTERRTPW